MEPARGSESLGWVLRFPEGDISYLSPFEFPTDLQCEYLQMSMQMCTGQRSTSGSFLSLSLPDVLRQGLSQDPELTCSHRLADQSIRDTVLASQHRLTDGIRGGFYLGLQSLFRSSCFCRKGLID